VMGVCAEGILSGATGKVSVAGPVTVKTTGAVTAWHVLISSTTAGYAKDGGASNAYAFAVAVTSSAGGLSTVQAILIPTGARTADTLVDLVKDFNIEVVIGSGLSEISTGVMGFLEVPTDCTIQGWSIVGDQSGSIVIDVWKDTYANFPPTVADTIAGSEKPTLSSAQKNQDLSLSTWTTGLSKGDWLGFNVDSASTVTQVTLSIRCVRA